MPSDAISVPVFQDQPLAHLAERARDEDDGARAFQEINARRAELERPELLRTIRAL
jgi:hypothetical protein